MADDLDEYTPRELGRVVREVLVRVNEIATRLEVQFIRKDVFELAMAQYKAYTDSLEHRLTVMEGSTISKDRADAMQARIDKLESTNEWLTRSVLGFVIVAVLGIAFAGSKGVFG